MAGLISSQFILIRGLGVTFQAQMMPQIFAYSSSYIQLVYYKIGAEGIRYIKFSDGVFVNDEKAVNNSDTVRSRMLKLF